MFCEEFFGIGIRQIPIFELSRPKQDYNILEYNIDYQNVMQSQSTEASKATDQLSVIDKLVQFTTALQLLKICFSTQAQSSIRWSFRQLCHSHNRAKTGSME